MSSYISWSGKTEAKKNTREMTSYLLAANQFEMASVAERMRVDRNGSLVSLLLIELSKSYDSQSDLEKLVSYMVDRLRITDTVGYLKDGRIGVLLPDTPASGAWKVAADLCELFPPGERRPDCEVFSYPESPQQRHQETPDSETEKLPLNTAAELPNHSANFTKYESLSVIKMPLWKRTLDIAGASFGLLVFSPIIASAAIAIKLTSPGDAFFLQEREGLAGSRFKMYKLRTMRADAEKHKTKLRKRSSQDGPAFKMDNDPRITVVGRFLRKTSLDELPQLINVLRGEMSLVGPRPLPTDESLACQPWQRQRLLVTPGVTCIWQVYGRNSVPFDEWIRMDLEYASKRSFWFDLKLVANTFQIFVKRTGK